MAQGRDLNIREYRGIGYGGGPNYTDDPKFMNQEVKQTVQAAEEVARKYVPPYADKYAKTRKKGSKKSYR